VTEFSAAGRFEYAGVIPGLAAPALTNGGFTGPDPAADVAPSTGDLPVLSYDAMFGGAPAESPADADHDGLSDAFEKLAGTNAHLRDTDHDGLDDAYEAIDTHTDPLSADTDHDQVSDASEVAIGADPGSIPGIAGVSGQGQFAENIRHGINDADHDGLSDLFEQRAGLNAHSADSDSDGLSDSSEVALGTNPDAADSDQDGLADSFEVRFGMDPLHAPTPAAGIGDAGIGDGLGTVDPDVDPLAGGTDPDDAMTPGGSWP
jgi:thrombospondin type 3 repeat protein